MTVETENLPKTADEARVLLHKAKVTVLYSQIALDSALASCDYDEIQIAKRDLNAAEDKVKELVAHLLTLL